MSTGPFTPEHPGQGRDNLAATEIDSQGLNAVPQLPGHVHWPSYEFLEFDESSLEQEDRTFLANKGSLSVPEAAALDEFVRHYFLHLHPILPLLDEAEFWNSYTQCGNKSKVSLLVLQAMLFAGCPYISINTLQRCGFNSKRDARSHFYKRAKFLFGLAEYHPVVRTQAAILLSHHASAAEPRAGSEWLALAIQNAHLIDRIPGRRPTGDSMQRKRLWWSIILRDRYLCLTLHRRTQVPEISKGLDLDALDEDVLSCEIQSSLVYDPEAKVMLVKILKEYYELALALSDMVPLVYASHGINTASLSGDACIDNLNRAKGAKRSLEEWKASSSLPILMAQVTQEPATLFANLIHMYYYAARINLAHFELLIMQQQPEFVSGYDEKLRNITSELHNYMSQQSIIMEYLGHCGRSQILPLSVIGCLPMPLLTTAINISLSPSAHQREIHKRRIDTFGQIVRNLEQVYEAATMISSGMSHFLQLAYTTIQLSSEPEPVLPSNSAVCFEAGPTNEHQTTPPPPTWKEFLLQSPHAYLLIATTVDFSLSLGHLPRTDSLPDLLTCLLPRCLRICLPWDNNPISSARSPDNVQDYFELNSRQNPPPTRGGRERSRMEILNRFRMQQQAKKAEEEFNLDYLDLSAVG